MSEANKSQKSGDEEEVGTHGSCVRGAKYKGEFVE